MHKPDRVPLPVHIRDLAATLMRYGSFRIHILWRRGGSRYPRCIPERKAERLSSGSGVCCATVARCSALRAKVKSPSTLGSRSNFCGFGGYARERMCSLFCEQALVRNLAQTNSIQTIDFLWQPPLWSDFQVDSAKQMPSHYGTVRGGRNERFDRFGVSDPFWISSSDAYCIRECRQHDDVRL